MRPVVVPLCLHTNIKIPTSTQVARTRRTLKRLLAKYPKLQQQKIGTVKGIKTPLNLKEGATPTFMKARPVPYSLRSSVEEELKRLVEGIVYPVESSEWATPVVEVPKKDGKIRICGDLRVTINKSIQVNIYPLPWVEDIFYIRGKHCIQQN